MIHNPRLNPRLRPRRRDGEGPPVQAAAGEAGANLGPFLEVVSWMAIAITFGAVVAWLAWR